MDVPTLCLTTPPIPVRPTHPQEENHETEVPCHRGPPAGGVGHAGPGHRLGLPRLVNAQTFGVRIKDDVQTTYQMPNVAMQARAGTSPRPDASFATGFLNGTASTSASASISNAGWDLTHVEYGEAAVSADAKAAMGALGASASLRVSSTDTSALAFGFCNLANAGFSIDAMDDISLQSSSLGSGSWVNVRFTLTLASRVAESGDATLGVGEVEAMLRFNSEGGPSPHLEISDSDFRSPAQRTVSEIVALQIGQSYRMWQSMKIFAHGDASYSGSGSLTPTPANWTLDIDADHTSLAFVDVLGDARLSTASGHDYALVPVPQVPAVPEPDAYALMLAGLGVLSWVARRRRAG